MCDMVNIEQKQLKPPGKSPSLLTYGGSPSLKVFFCPLLLIYICEKHFKILI